MLRSLMYNSLFIGYNARGKASLEINLGDDDPDSKCYERTWRGVAGTGMSTSSMREDHGRA